jgi:hypothetical protein
MNRALWIVQTLLAALFIFGGCAKLAMPVEELSAAAGMPGLFLQFIGVAEVLGGLGLILPGLLRIATGLTPLAAAGLTIIMVGAVGTVLLSDGMVAASIPLVVGILTALVAYSRAVVRPHGQPARRQPLVRAAA